MAFAASLPMKAQTNISVDMTKAEAGIPALIYGAGTEDVNHEIYGGLYDQRIFGESFEEEIPAVIENFTPYDSPWQAKDGILKVHANGHGKIIYNKRIPHKSSVTADVRMNEGGSIAGFIVNVSHAGAGADNFHGYEISLNADKRTLVVGKHENNWQPVTEVPVDFIPTGWNNLRADIDGAKITIWLNGNKIHNLVDTVRPLTGNLVGLRSFGGSASFKNIRINHRKTTLASHSTGVSAMWEPVGKGTYTHDDKEAFNGCYSQKITGKTGDGICNRGLNKWGIHVAEGKEMLGYVYLKGDATDAVVAMQSADGSKVYCHKQLTGITDNWQRFDFRFTPSATDENARFVVTLGSKGAMWVDMAMLHTNSYPFRKDIMEAFKQEGLTFLRYGGTMINAPEYKVKNMMGCRDQRPPYIGHWYKNSTNGFGIIEFVEFARLINTEPTFSINIEDNPQDVLKLLRQIEPHNLRYIEIGNEENIGDESMKAYEHYVKRFMAFYDAIHPVYPNLQFINAAWWRANKPEIMEYVFRSLDGKSSLWDYHPWTDEVAQACAVETELKNMRDLFWKWNPQTDMKCAILEENGNTHCLHRALSHAVVLNVVRKMDGFVQLDSPANALQPYLQNDNGWDQGQIFFNSSSVWCQPPYYAQQMAAAHHLPILIKSDCSNPNLHITATKDEEGNVAVLHIVNPIPTPLPVAISIIGMDGAKPVEAVNLSGRLTETNTPQAPRKIVPQDIEWQDMKLTLPPTSYTVIKLSKPIKHTECYK